MTMLNGSSPAQAGFLTFDGAHGAVEDHGATRRHQMPWLTRGSLPRSGRGVHERYGQNRPMGRAHGRRGPPVARLRTPALALSYTLDISGPTATRLVAVPGARARDAPPA